MSFWQLNVVFVGLALAVLATAALAGRVRRRHLGALAATVAVLWICTAIFDNVMIAAGLFDYGHELLGGVYLGLAPLEDFAYPLGSALLLPALWLLLTGRRERGGRGAPRRREGPRGRTPSDSHSADDEGR